MNRVYKKRINIFIMTLFFVNIFLSQFSINVKAAGEIVKVEKNVNKTSALPGEEIDITLNVKGTPLTKEAKPSDVILVIDKSNSMRGKKIEDAKNSAKAFIDLMDMKKHRVGIVDFSYVVDSMQLTDNVEEAKKYIDKIKDDSATYTGDAVRKAKELLVNHRPEAQPVIVIMTDGAANTGGSDIIGFNDAKAAAKEAKDAGIVFYTIALLNSGDNPDTSPQNVVLKEMATTAQHHHFVLGSVGLEEIYKRIVKEIGIASAYDVNIKDVVSSEFEIVPGSYDNNIPKPQINGNKISWHLQELKDQDLTFKYKIRSKKDTKLGTYPVASESNIQYKDNIGVNKTIDINIPSVTLGYPSPTIMGITPAEGYIDEAKIVKITGFNFKAGAKVKFGDKEATNVKVESDTAIIATVPIVDIPKEVDVKVINADSQEGKLEKAYTYMERIVPVIERIEPNWGYITDDTKYIKIYGSKFKLGARVYIGGVESTNVNSHRLNYLYVKVPVSDKPAIVDIKVVNPGGKEAVLKGGFTYKNLPAPEIEYANPNEGEFNQEKTITIYGKWFQKGTKVKIGDKEALETTVYGDNSTYIKVKVPAVDAPKTVDIKVINPDGKEAILKGGFTYKDTPGPEIRCISPNEGIYNEEKNIAIYASNFKPGVKVKIGDKDALSVSLCGTYIYAKVPVSDAPKSVDVTVINPDGKEAKVINGYTYKAKPEILPPTIKSYSSYTIFGQNKLDIYGYNLSKNMVLRNVATGEEFTSLAPATTYVTFKMPDSYKGQKVKFILVNKDENKESAPYEFKILGNSNTIPQMTISSVSPNHGKLEGGYCVGIYGTNFASDSEIYVDGKKVDNIQYSSSSLMYITKMPARSTDGQVDIEVRSASLGQSKTIKFTYDPKPIIPPPTIKSYSSYTIFGQNKLDIYGYNLSKNMVLRNVATGEEFVCLAPATTYVTFKMPDSYRGRKVTCVLVNKDENKESAPYEFQIK